MGTLHEIAKAANVDSNDIIHRAMLWQIALLPIILVWGLVMESLQSFEIVKAFDLRAVFEAVLFFETGAGTLLVSGTASLFFRKTANADGSVSETENITTGKQPDIVNQTTIVR